MAWKPAAASAGSWWRHEYQSSGNPWQSTTGGPSPCSAMCMSIPLAWIVRWVTSLMSGTVMSNPSGEAIRMEERRVWEDTHAEQAVGGPGRGGAARAGTGGVRQVEEVGLELRLIRRHEGHPDRQRLRVHP